MDAFLARQPIFDRQQKLIAYELLYRDSHDSDVANFDDPDDATGEVLVNTFMNIGLDRITGSHRAFINFTAPFLTGELELPFSPDQVTLEVLEHVQPTPEVLAGLRRLRDAGYQIALDDFALKPELIPLVKLASLIKLDIRDYSEKQLRTIVERLKPFDIELLAEKVETAEEYRYCRDIGFDFFQGYFFCRPNIVSGKSASASKLATLRLIEKLNDPKFSFDELEQLVGTDPTLVYKLLRYINSAYFGFTKKIESIRGALMMLGEKNIRLWLNLIALSRLSDVNRELMITSLTRAKLCEKMCGDLGDAELAQKGFLTGLFASIDAFVDAPMEEILDSIHLSDELKAALIQGEGVCGEVLEAVRCIERGMWGECTDMKLSLPVIADHYLEAIDWADSTVQELEG